MFKGSNINLFLVLLVMITASSCLKPSEYSEIPSISFRSFESFGDTAYLSIDFTDGDGDVGLDEGDVNPPYDTSSKFHYNLFLTYYEKVNGTFQKVQDFQGNDIEFNFRVPVLTPRGQNKALKGMIRVTIAPIYYHPDSDDSDTIMYEIQLADRALHLSEVIRTDEIIR